jgi:hypothetical protein
VTRAVTDHLQSPDAGLEMLWIEQHQFCLRRSAASRS